jgi:ATP-binding cassette subfamily C protein CydCD
VYFNLRLWAMTEGLRPAIFLAAAVGLIAMGIGIARLAIIGIVIARLFQGEAFSSIVVPLVLVAALILLRGVFQYVRDTVSNRTSTRTKIELRRRLYQHSLDLGPGHFDQRRTGDVLMSLVDGVENLEVFFGQYLPQFMVAAIAPVLIFVFMSVLDIRIGLVFVIFALVTLFLPAVIQKLNRSRNQARRKAYGDLGADFLDSVQGLATLKSFGQAKRRGELLAVRARTLFRTTMKVLAADGASGGATTLGISAGAIVALVWGGIRVNDGQMELQSLLIILMLGGEVFRPLRELVGLYHQGMAAMSAADGIFALLDTPPTVRDPETPASASDDGLAPEVRFEAVEFAYQGDRRPALRDVSFTLNAGEVLGVVGASGAGKSTLVWMLLRFYDPQTGRITLGGHDLRDLPLETLRRQFSVVTQDTYIFQGTIADNLRLGKPGATPAAMEEAARAANAHEFISALPDGYDSWIGERGVRLSEGERQKLAIARALLKAAPILLLDEALSSVDSENEAAIQEALDRLMVGKTTLIIAHRLSSVIGADRILVLEQGRVVESGSPAELTGAGGVYARLMASQQSAPETDLLAATLPSAQADAEGGTLREATPAAEARRGADSVARHVSSVEIWRRLFNLVRRWRGELALSLGLGLLYHASLIALGAISALLVAEVFKGSDYAPYLIALGVLAPLTALFRWGESWASHDLAFRLLAEIRIDMYDALEPLAPAYLVKRKSGDLVSIVGGDIETIEFFFAHVITPAVIAFLVPAVVLIVLAFVSWPLSIVLAPFLVLAAVSPFFAQRTAEQLGHEMRSRLGDLTAFVVDGIQGMREIAAFGAGADRVEETDRRGWALSKYRVRFLDAQASHAVFIEALTAVGGLAVLATGAWLVVEGNMARTDLPLATLLALTSFGPVNELATTLKHMMETHAASRRVFEVHDEPVVVNDGPGVALVPTHSASANSAISFEGVGFAYGPGLPEALRDVSLKLESGQTVALVGRSGAGKTTCAQMLLRFWDPLSGRITLQGHDIRDFKLDALRRNIALVAQDTYLFNATIRENLRIAGQDTTDTDIERAAEMANATEFIDAMPDGYETPVGERGMQLSGGQRQRISIARALLKDAPMLILDEATSHLDAVNEQQIRQALERLMEGRTTLVIAHRLSTVRDADRIVVLDRGRVAEQGTHTELLANAGLYAQLVRTQIVSASGQAGQG